MPGERVHQCLSRGFDEEVQTGQSQCDSRAKLIDISLLPGLYPCCIEAVFDFVLGPPLPGRESGRPAPQENRWFWAGSGPDPGGSKLLILLLALSTAGVSTPSIQRHPLQEASEPVPSGLATGRPAVPAQDFPR